MCKKQETGTFRVHYIGHSGFAVELRENGEVHAILIFDYYQGELPELPKKVPVYIFSSHRHQDHFQFQIFSWYKRFAQVHYILSKDIGKKYKKKYMMEKRGLTEEMYDAIHFLQEGEHWEDENISVDALPSTDIGVSFLVSDKRTRKQVFHAGDLNWWAWEGETESQAGKMERDFQEALQKIKGKIQGEELDLVFFPLDGRLEKNYYLGFHTFAQEIPLKFIYPMHCFGDLSVIDRLKGDPISEGYRNKICIY